MFAERLADLDSPGLHKNVLAMPPPMTMRVGEAGQVPEEFELGRNFCAADDGDERALGFFQSLFKGAQFRFHGAAGVGGMRWAMPSVELWARWAAEKASFTKMSPRPASIFAKPGSFFSSPAW